MQRVARVIGISLGLMLLSGIAVMIPTKGAYGMAWWFRVAFVLFIVLGSLNGIAGRPAQGQRPSVAASEAAVARLPTLAWAMVES